jgi:hypothetical protein
MGIHIHKVIGYGLHNALQTKKERASFEVRYEAFQEMDRTEILTWIKENRQTIEALFGSAERGGDLDCLFAGRGTIGEDLNSCEGHRLFWEPEFGKKKAILIRPLWGAREWYRHDNLMDHIEENEAHRNLPARWQYLTKSLYPYEWRKPPASVAAVCVFLGIEHLYPKLKEALYVYWS